ncbi:unnamed protein product [Moneuplotes crassus]|uniref:PH domain-containing protein n=1 Tax=Euplotes crassus TaxID=5936 RepID=A0AAD1Y1N6_EUPCR|nr:unnamed protein product [Moneuplotes crassus]
MVLEGQQEGPADWRKKNCILTEQTIYFFNKNDDVMNTEPISFSLLTTAAVYKGNNPGYRSKIQICRTPYIYFVELKFKSKRRIITMNSKTKAKDWVKTINLRHNYLRVADGCNTAQRKKLNQWMEQMDSNNGIIELHLSMITDETYPILKKFLKNAHIRVPNIYVKEEKFKEIRKIAGAKEIDEEEYNTKKFNWDTDISKKGMNVQKMMDLILDLPKENDQNGKSTKRGKALKRFKDIIIHYMTNTNHKANFKYEQLSDSFEVASDNSYIGDLVDKEPENYDDSEEDDYLWQKNQTLLNNEELFKAAERNDLFTLEVLCEGYNKIGIDIPERVKQKVWQLKNEARYVTENLVKVVNMDTENDHELNDLLDICLSKAKNIGMRGELIDIGYAIKDFRDRATSELIDIPKKNCNFKQEEFSEMEFFQIFDKKETYSDTNFAKIFENGNLLDNLNQVITGDKNGVKDESLTSESQSEVSVSNTTSKGYITCNVCKNHISISKYKEHSAKETMRSRIGSTHLSHTSNISKFPASNRSGDRFRPSVLSGVLNNPKGISRQMESFGNLEIENKKISSELSKKFMKTVQKNDKNRLLSRTSNNGDIDGDSPNLKGPVTNNFAFDPRKEKQQHLYNFENHSFGKKDSFKMRQMPPELPTKDELRLSGLPKSNRRSQLFIQLFNQSNIKEESKDPTTTINDEMNKNCSGYQSSNDSTIHKDEEGGSSKVPKFLKPAPAPTRNPSRPNLKTSNIELDNVLHKNASQVLLIRKHKTETEEGAKKDEITVSKPRTFENLTEKEAKDHQFEEDKGQEPHPEEAEEDDILDQDEIFLGSPIKQLNLLKHQSQPSFKSLKNAEPIQDFKKDADQSPYKKGADNSYSTVRRSSAKNSEQDSSVNPSTIRNTKLTLLEIMEQKISKTNRSNLSKKVLSKAENKEILNKKLDVAFDALPSSSDEPNDEEYY